MLIKTVGEKGKLETYLRKKNSCIKNKISKNFITISNKK